MKGWLIILVTVPLSVAAGVLALRSGLFQEDAGTAEGGDAEVAAALADLEQTLARLTAENARLAGQIEARRAPAGAGPEAGAGEGATGLDELGGSERLERALAAWLEEHQAPPASLAAPAPAPTSEEEEILARLEIEEVLTLLDSSEGPARARVWTALGRTGRIAEVLAELEARIQDPGNVAERMLLAGGYMQARDFASDLRESWMLAEKADKVLGEVLAADPSHFEARFAKAQALSQWPAHYGRAKEAIEHFEVLRADGARSGLQPEHARVYLFLGSLLQQSGDGPRALEVWREGLELFPDDAELRERLARNER